jgi:hypothetical protein
VPTGGSWNKEAKSTLMGFFWEEIQPHLDPIQAIQPTFAQVSMRKVNDSVEEAPLTNAFLKALRGKADTLFPDQKFQSFQQLETSAGIPIPVSDLVADSKKFKNDALVMIKKNLKVKEKRLLMDHGFVECVPHLVSLPCFMYCSFILLIDLMSILLPSSHRTTTTSNWQQLVISTKGQGSLTGRVLLRCPFNVRSL